MAISYTNSFLQRFPETYDLVEHPWILDKVFWAIDWRYRVAVDLQDWVKRQIENPSEELVSFANSIPTGEDYDETSVNCLKAVKGIIKYQGDKTTWDVEELWQPGLQTFMLRTGDCEDGAILLYILCRLKGIPANRLYLLAGSVVGGGHCWLGYKPIHYPLNFVFLDWCYNPDLSRVSDRNIYTINDVTITVESGDEFYQEIWFAFNENQGVKSMSKRTLKI